MLSKLTQLSKWIHLSVFADQKGWGDPKVAMVEKSVVQSKVKNSSFFI